MFQELFFGHRILRDHRVKIFDLYTLDGGGQLLLDGFDDRTLRLVVSGKFDLLSVAALLLCVDQKTLDDRDPQRAGYHSLSRHGDVHLLSQFQFQVSSNGVCHEPMAGATSGV